MFIFYALGIILYMKAAKVLKLLQITRPTLCKYVKQKKNQVKTFPNGYYDYDDELVYRFLNKDLHREVALYCRVSKAKQKNDLYNQQKKHWKNIASIYVKRMNRNLLN